MSHSGPDRPAPCGSAARAAADETSAWRAAARPLLTPADFFPRPPRPSPRQPGGRGAHIVMAFMVLVVVLAGATALMIQQRSPYSRTRVGGAFALVDTDGRRVTQADLAGRPTVLYFGYTSCPDVCPTTLALLTRVMGRLGAAANRLNAVFVSVDPERDTPAALKDYLGSFDPRIRGLTGTEAEVADMADTFHVVRHREPSGGSYVMTHSADALLLNGAGRVVGELYYGEDEGSVFAKLTTLAPEPVCRPGAPGPADLWAPTASFGPRQLCGTG